MSKATVDKHIVTETEEGGEGEEISTDDIYWTVLELAKK